jgi:hypothetical protein
MKHAMLSKTAFIAFFLAVIGLQAHGKFCFAPLQPGDSALH